MTSKDYDPQDKDYIRKQDSEGASVDYFLEPSWLVELQHIVLFFFFVYFIPHLSALGKRVRCLVHAVC